MAVRVPGDIDALVALLTDDVYVSMPPIPLEYQGRADVARFYAAILRRDWTYDFVPTRANGQLALGAYLRAPTGIHGIGLVVLTLSGAVTESPPSPASTPACSRRSGCHAHSQAESSPLGRTLRIQAVVWEGCPGVRYVEVSRAVRKDAVELVRASDRPLR